MKKLYDSKNKRLIFVDETASADFWDKRWMNMDIKKALEISKDYLVVPTTEKYLAQPHENKRILEGGSGSGQFVHLLDSVGYDVIGIDYAQNTVKKINELRPDLKVQFGDVRKLEFENNSFDGYWSLGVIEHFFDGYDKIADEMKRVIKPGGYVFLTVPHMSPLRKFKAKLGIYPNYKKKNEERIRRSFYQFALDPSKVVADFKGRGFKLIQKKRFDGMKGLKDEIPILKPIFERIYNSRNIFARGINYLINLVFASLTGHTILLVLKKK